MSEQAPTLDTLYALRDTGRSIKATVAFQEWQRQVLAQAEGRKNGLLQPLKSLEALLEQEFQKGEALGLIQAFRQLDLLIEMAEVQIAETIADAEAAAQQGEGNETQQQQTP